MLFNLRRLHRLGKSPDPEKNPSFPQSWIDGLQTTPLDHTPADGTHVLGVLFEPIGFHALFGAEGRTPWFEGDWVRQPEPSGS